MAKGKGGNRGKSGSSGKRGRSAVTGKFVKQETVRRRPDKTVNESTKKRKG
jgi:hypothetical protein